MTFAPVPESHVSQRALVLQSVTLAEKRCDRQFEAGRKVKA